MLPTPDLGVLRDVEFNETFVLFFVENGCPLPGIDLGEPEQESFYGCASTLHTRF